MKLDNTQESHGGRNAQVKSHWKRAGEEKDKGPNTILIYRRCHEKTSYV